MTRKTRAVTTSLSYVQTLAITTILVSGLLISFGAHVENQRDRVADRELEVVGQQLAGQIVDADHVVRATDGSANVRIRPDVPGQVAGRTYTVEVNRIASTDRYELYLRSNPGSVNVTVSFTVRTAVAEGTASGGGNLLVRYTGSSIEVTNG